MYNLGHFVNDYCTNQYLQYCVWVGKNNYKKEVLNSKTQ